MESLRSHSYFSRAGKASLSKFKILLDKDRILNGDTIRSKLFRVKSEQILPQKQIGNIIDQELEKLKNV